MTEKEAEEFQSTLKKYNCPEKKVVTLPKFKELMKNNVELYGFKVMKKSIYGALTENQSFDKNMKDMDNEQTEHTEE
jgi:hypothetical protein